MKKEFLKEIQAFLRAHRMQPSTFGLKAMNDKSFVTDLMINGRDVKTSTIERVRKFMREYEKDRVA
jgi:predicted transcriptional regulator